MPVALTLLDHVSFRGREIAGARLHDLLALLAEDPRAGCGVGRIVDELWPERSPEHPVKAVQLLVSRARRQLGADTIVRTGTGYRLTLEPAEIDASAVREWAARAARHARAGEHTEALAAAEAGLSWWPGSEPVADGLGSGPLAALRRGSEDVRAVLVRHRGLALSRLGRSAEAAAVLAVLVARDPLDEEVLTEVLRAESATTGAASALARYERYRRMLRTEWGTEPGPALTELHRQLLWQSVPAARHGVEHEPNPLLGRQDDITAVLACLRRSRVTSVVGPGGIGKTRLAHAVGRDPEHRVVHVVGLAGLSADTEVLPEVAAALGVVEPRRSALLGTAQGEADLARRVAASLGRGPVLLVLDNCEHVVDGVADLVRVLVAVTTDVRVLTTSRTPLGLTSEAVHPLRELDTATAAELFRQRASAARPGAELPQALVEQVCDQLDGLPLAIELAAARVRVLSVAQLARRLDDRFAVLRTRTRDTPRRHRTLHSVVEWSWNLLAPGERRVMRLLSAFPSGFTAGAAQHVLAADDAATLAVLERLADHSMIKVVDTATDVRFHMLETVREYSAAECAATGEAELARARFVSWAREYALAHYREPLGDRPATALLGLRSEQDNLLRALRIGLDAADGSTVAVTGAALAALWTLESNYQRLSRLPGDTAWLLSHYRPAPEYVEATRTLAVLCVVYRLTLHDTQVLRSLLVLRRLPPALPDTLVRALAVVCADLTVVEDDRLAELCASERPLLSAVAHAFASYVREHEGDLTGAIAAATGLVRAVEGADTRWLRVLARARLAEIHLTLGEGREALRQLAAAREVDAELVSLLDSIGIQGATALAALQTRDVAWAERELRTVPEDAFGDRAHALAVRGELALLRGDVDGGLALWREAAEAMSLETLPGARVEPGAEPWSLEFRAVAVVAHARHGRLALVADLVERTPQALDELLRRTHRYEPEYLTGAPLCGALVLAVAMVDLDRARRLGEPGAARSGASLVALALAFGYTRQFQPTMAEDAARAEARRADPVAYEQALAHFGGLDHHALRTAALAALRQRPVSADVRG
ncbi:hypothetical protein B1813_08000 [Saccharomonospora piscinae]|uniref:Bacterial transcriptional activator domain-containing protein n=1 Tax=Saccharomonospora piscinae TaxID=687388 RepID=A0A1V9A7P1_SACPI|nr:BTAD domain-containing putative transcriptional regulator [Saccharomonospora piscinae]OQO93113.1 hypothetical protein B1813_08000 [Saccharomonospora piscinae]